MTGTPPGPIAVAGDVTPAAPAFTMLGADDAAACAGDTCAIAPDGGPAH
ncbi:MAG: hypothetical protein MUD13_05960 [Candidatus Nanopelagicales bacterium]|jgi:hypothetical protein|nr:hypothetical protein [Candidatus Nanopelagicales bacterium]